MRLRAMGNEKQYTLRQNADCTWSFDNSNLPSGLGRDFRNGAEAEIALRKTLNLQVTDNAPIEFVGWAAPKT